jgi:hypothetical protein
MRELTLLETGYLAGLLLFSLDRGMLRPGTGAHREYGHLEVDARARFHSMGEQ